MYLLLFIFLVIILLGIYEICFKKSFKLDSKEQFTSNNDILWSKCCEQPESYNLKGTEKISTKKEILAQIQKGRPVLWIRNTSRNKNIPTDLDYLVPYLDKITTPIVLITSDGDRAVPSSYQKSTTESILNHPKISKWLTQNYDRSTIHPKLGHYPIGLDLHTKKWLDNSINSRFQQRLAKVQQYLSLKDTFKQHKKNRIFVDSHLSISHPRRTYMHHTLKNHPLIDFLPSKLHHPEILEHYASYRFVVSPRGNGLDCHRTWEIMLLGSIPIVESSSLDEMFIKHHLPVIIVSDFKELNGIDSNQLDSWWQSKSPLTKSDKLLPKFKPRYWINNFPNSV